MWSAANFIQAGFFLVATHISVDGPAAFSLWQVCAMMVLTLFLTITTYFISPKGDHLDLFLDLGNICTFSINLSLSTLSVLSTEKLPVVVKRDQ